jgi:integrase/recombinase XerD
MAGTTIYGRIIALTKARFGHAVNPHLFGDSAATSVATEDPSHVYIVKNVLGHSTLKTAERYYMHAQAVDAAQRHQKLVLALRRRSRESSADASPES